MTVLLSRGLIRVAQVIAFVVLARVLSPEEFGWFGIITTALAVAGILGSLGLRQSFAYQIGQQRLTAGEAVGTALILWPILTALSAAVIFLLYGQQIPGVGPVEAALMICSGVASWILLTTLQGVFLGQGRIWQFSLSEALPRTILMVGVVGLAFVAQVSLSGALWANVASFLLPLPLVIVLALRGGGRIGQRCRDLGTMLNYGLIFAFNLFLITLCSRISMFVIEHYAGADSAGQFFAAVRINEIFLEAASAVGLVLFSRAARQEAGDSAIDEAVQTAAWLFWAFLLLAGVIALAAPVLLNVLVGTEYDAAVPALQLLALSLAPTAASKVIYPSLAGSGKPFFGTPVIVLSLVLNTALAIILVPANGVMGGAIALVAGQYTLFIGYVIVCWRREGIPVRRFVIPFSRGKHGPSGSAELR